MINGVSSVYASYFASRLAEPRDPQPAKTSDELLAEWRAANRMNFTPQQALQSGAELWPAYSGPTDADNHASKLHTEIKVDGKVVARIYNSGVMETPNEYSFLSDELNFENKKLLGPDLAEDRARLIEAALKKYGAVTRSDLSEAEIIVANLAKKPLLDVVRAPTAQTQKQWEEYIAERAKLDPGSLFSKSA